MAFEGLMKGKRGLITGVANNRSLPVMSIDGNRRKQLATEFEGRKRVCPYLNQVRSIVVPGSGRSKMANHGTGLLLPTDCTCGSFANAPSTQIWWVRSLRIDCMSHISSAFVM